MYSYKGFIIVIAFYFVRGEDVENVLAETNLKGYPSSLLFDSVSASQNEVTNIDKLKLAQLLESKEVQAAVTKSALQYSAQAMNQSGQARFLNDPSLCENSWVSWLPWMNCEATLSKTPATKLPLISDSASMCY